MTGEIAVHIISIGDYDQGVGVPFPSLGENGALALEEATRIGELFSGLGADVLLDVETPASQRNADWAKRGQTGWADRPSGPSTVLVWIGHGVSDGSQAWLASYHSDARNPNSGHNASELATTIHMEWASREQHDGAWAIVVVEACGADRFVDLVTSEIATKFASAPKRIVLVSAGGEGTTFLGTFGRALQQVSDSFTDNDDAIDVWDFAHRLGEHLEPYGGGVATRSLAGATPIHRPKLFTEGIIATQDVAVELQRFISQLPDEYRAHYIPKAQGSEQGEAAWFFTGRSDERRAITAWLASNTSGLLVVTGLAGSGKSALLGNLLVHSTPDLRELLIAAGRVERLPPEEQPRDDQFDVVLALTGQSLDDATSRIAASVGCELPTDADAGERVAVLTSWIEASGRPITLMIDALDESIDPLAIARSLLRPLALGRGTRIVLGTRSSTNEHLDQASPDDRNILDALGVSEQLSVITVPVDGDAVRNYVAARLLAARAEGRLEFAASDEVEATAARIAALAPRFIFARLLVHEILAEPQLLTVDGRPELDQLLAGTHAATFVHAVQRLERQLPRSFAILEALAFAEGRGLPRADGLWAAVASALTAGETITDPDIAATLDAAAPYLMLDGEAGQSVYRLAHQTFRERFRSDELEPSGRSRQDAVFRALLDAATRSEQPALNHYLRLHLARHAVGAEAWELLAQQPRVLDGLDITSLANASFSMPAADRPLAIIGTLLNRREIELEPRHNRESLRVLGEARVTGLARMSYVDREAPLQVDWATRFEPETPIVPFTGHVGSVEKVLSVDLDTGARAIVSVGADSTLRVWDPASGVELHEPTTFGPNWPSSSAVYRAADRDYVVVGSANVISVVDPNTSRVVERCEHDERIQGLYTVPLADGTVAVLTLRSDGSLILCDPGPNHRQRIVGDSVSGVETLLRRDGTTLAAIVDRNGLSVVRLGAEIVPMMSEPGVEYIRSLALLENDAGRVAVAVGFEGLLSSDGPNVTIWDASTGEELGYLPDPSRQAHSLRATDAMVDFRGRDGRQLLITTDGTATVAWDPFANTFVRNLGIASSSQAQLVVQVTGAPVLVLASMTRIRVLDPETGEMLSEMTLSGVFIRDVVSIGTPDELVLAVGSTDGGIRLWRPYEHGAISRSDARHVGGGRGLSVFEGTDGSGGVVVDERGNRWRLEDGALQPRLVAAPVWISWTSRLGSHRIAGVVSQSGLHVWDPFSTDPSRRILKRKRIARLHHRGSKTLAIAVGRRTVTLWDADNGERIGQPIRARVGRPGTTDVVVDPAGTTLLVIDGGTRIDLWDPQDGRVVASFPTAETTPRSGIRVLTQSDGRAALIYEGVNSTAHVIDLARGVEPSTPESLGRVPFGSVRLDAQGRVVVVGMITSSEALQFWYPLDDEFRALPAPGAGRHNTFAFLHNPGGNALLITGDLGDVLTLWNADTGERIEDLPLGAHVWELTPVTGGVLCSTDGGLVKVAVRV